MSRMRFASCCSALLKPCKRSVLCHQIAFCLFFIKNLKNSVFCFLNYSLFAAFSYILHLPSPTSSICPSKTVASTSTATRPILPRMMRPQHPQAPPSSAVPAVPIGKNGMDTTQAADRPHFHAVPPATPCPTNGAAFRPQCPNNCAWERPLPAQTTVPCAKCCCQPMGLYVLPLLML